MSQTITAAQLKAIAGTGARPDLISAIVRGWPNAIAKAKLTSKLRAAHFIAQIMTETGGLQILEESGAYRAPRIMAIFGVGKHSAKVTEAEARQIAALPVASRGPVLFNRVYGVGNPTKMREFQNTGPNDGWLYRGGGMMQATGKSNYAAMAKKTGLPLVEHPELLHQPDSAFMAAYLEWAQDGRCNAAADRDDVVEVRRIINGGKNGLAECQTYLAKAKEALADYSVTPAPVVALDPPPEPPAVAPAPPVIDVPAAPAPPVDPGVVGDPELYAVQKRLKALNYSPGVLDGRWGGGTSGAISGFINDRGGHIAVPASLDAFNAVREDIKAELQQAESENWVRPVSDARKAADPKVVEAVAPEVVPVRRNFLASAWAAVLAVLTAVWNWVSESVSSAWGFFTDHKDDLPEVDSGFLHTAWGYLSSVPVTVWALAIAGLFVFIALNSRAGVSKITEQVQSGARQ